jgi:ApbE superfamily uncharacterized protein (UPF0280 family)
MGKDRAIHSSPHRHYRDRYAPRPGEFGFQVVVEQTDLWIVANQDLSDSIQTFVHELRGRLKAYMLLHPEFGPSLTPVAVGEGAPALVQEMAHAGQLCNVGPMAAVAGAIAQATAERFAPLSPDLLVENGGDTYLFSTRERVVGLLPDPQNEAALGVRIPASGFPTSLCASSSTIGHSLSLGHGELLVTRSPNGAFADAAATALLNLLKHKRDLDAMLARARELAVPRPGARPGHYLQGVLAQHRGSLAVWGEMELATL